MKILNGGATITMSLYLRLYLSMNKEGMYYTVKSLVFLIVVNSLCLARGSMQSQCQVAPMVIVGNYSITI